MDNTLKKLTYDSYLKDYEDYLTAVGEKTKSIKERISVIRKLFNFLTANSEYPQFSEIKKYHIKSFMHHSEAEGLEPTTLRRYFSFLKKFFLYYNRENENTNKIFDYWDYKIEGEPKSLELSDEEIDDLYNVIKLEEKSEQSFRTEIAFLILLYTGCTKNELCTLHIFNQSTESNKALNYISIEKKSIYFSKELKNGKIKRRELPINDTIINKIKEYVIYMHSTKGIDIEQYTYLFIAKYGEIVQLSADSLSDDIKYIVNKSKLIKDKRKSFQAFRNAFIKKLVKDNIPLQLIKEITGLEYASLKRYVKSVEDYEKNQKDTIFMSKHPFKNVFESLD